LQRPTRSHSEGAHRRHVAAWAIALVAAATAVSLIARFVERDQGPFEPFSTDSYYRTPVTGWPVDPRSAGWIGSIRRWIRDPAHRNDDWVLLTAAPGGLARSGRPVYWVTGHGAEFRIDCRGTLCPPQLASFLRHHETLRLPTDRSGHGPRPGAGVDRSLALFDLRDRVVIGLHGVWYRGHVLDADGGDIYAVRSGGIAASWAAVTSDSDRSNGGHRGFPSAFGQVRYDEVAWATSRSPVRPIPHALELFVPPVTGLLHCFPLTQGEARTSAPVAPPEGLRIRIRPDVDLSALHGAALVLAKTLQTYGAILADTSGNDAVDLSLEGLSQENVRSPGAPAAWPSRGPLALSRDALRPIPFDPQHWEVLRAGWLPGSDRAVPCST